MKLSGATQSPQSGAQSGTGTLVGLFLGSRLLGRVSVRSVEQWTLSALVVVATALICMVMLPMLLLALPSAPTIRIPAGIALGALVGTVSSVRSISGGELLIPALVLAFGVDIRIAGSASACISFPIVLASLIWWAG